MKLSLTRADLVEALDELIRELRAQSFTGEIRVVGGAALALSYFERDVTQDIDVLNVQGGSNDVVAEAARAVADRLSLAEDWLNFEVTKVDAYPTLGREVEWHTIYTSADIFISVASAEALLAMKLRANRPGRDVTDIRALLFVCDIAHVDSAAELYESFYPGDALPDRALHILTSIFGEGALEPVTPVSDPLFPKP
jgi:hypothetical protein